MSNVDRIIALYQEQEVYLNLAFEKLAEMIDLLPELTEEELESLPFPRDFVASWLVIAFLGGVKQFVKEYPKDSQ